MSAVTAVPLRPLAKGTVLKLWLALLVLCVAGAALAWVGTDRVQRTVTESGLQYQVIEPGEGTQITAADLLRIHLLGRRANGEIFANTLGGQPLETPTENFIPGFSEGLKLMRPGARYRFWIPPSLGYQGNVPPSAPFGPEETLIFEIQVVDVAPGMAQLYQMQQMQQMQQMMGPPPGAEGAPPGGAGPSGPPQGGSAPGGEAPPPAGNRQ